MTLKTLWKISFVIVIAFLPSICALPAHAMRMTFGTYTGNGASSRAITGIGFQPQVVIVKGASGDYAVIRTQTMTGDNSKQMGAANGFVSNRILSLDANGFTVGSNTEVNKSSTSYYWSAFEDTGVGDFALGTYSGTGVIQTINTVGFQPDYVMVISPAGQKMVQRSSAMTGDMSFQFDANNVLTNNITAITSSGFRVGTDSGVNASGRVYHYVAWKAVSGKTAVGSYLSNGSTASVTGLSFQPELVIIKGNAGVHGVHRPGSLTGNNSLQFTATSTITDAITSFITGGFALGSSNTVNSNNTTYYWTAFNSGNRAPVATDDFYNRDEDTLLSMNAPGVLQNDNDSDDLQTTLTAVLVSGPTHQSSFTLNADGSFSYMPALNFNGQDTFTYKVRDPLGAESNVATVTITINAVTDLFVANNDTYPAVEDTTLNIGAPGVLGNDNSVDAPPSQWTATQDNSITPRGQVVLNSDGSFTYTPQPDDFGTDTFTYRANDGVSDSNIASVIINIAQRNDPPNAVNDNYQTFADTQLAKSAVEGVLANDNDVDTPHENLVALLVAGPNANAVLNLNPDGSFSYVPPPNVSGSDSFTYRVFDGELYSNVVTVTIGITEHIPVATNDSYPTSEDGILDVAAPGVLSNDTDEDPGDTFIAVLVEAPPHAAQAGFQLHEDGSFSYTPQPDFNGVDTFRYRVFDGQQYSNVAMVLIDVTGSNDAPHADDQSVTTDEENAKTINLSASDIDSSSLTFTIVTSPTHGSLGTVGDPSCTADPNPTATPGTSCTAAVTYTPAANYNGSDSFTFKVNDGSLDSAEATISITVNPINDAPVSQNANATTDEDAPRIISLTATDIDNGNLTFAVVTGPAHGSLSTLGSPSCKPVTNGTGTPGSNCTATVTYTPAAHYFGADSFTFKSNDGSLDSNVATVSIVVNHVNHAPSANAGGPYSGTVGIPVQFSGSGSDPDGDPLTFSWSFGDGGTAAGANPTHTYASAATFNVTLTATDPGGLTGQSQTTAAIAPAFQLNPIGDKTVNLGQTLSFTVTVTNTSGAPSNLFVNPLPLANHASFNAGTGVFTFTPDTTQVGSFQLTFLAVSGNFSSSETITVTVPTPVLGTTSLTGIVQNLAPTLLENVEVKLKSTGTTARSGTNGVFTLVGVPSGRQEIVINGREAKINGITSVHAILVQPVDLIDGVLNALANPITLPDVDVTQEVQVSQTFNTIITSQNIPGTILEIIGGSATNADGTPYTGKLSINPVPDYGRPESRPVELQPGMAVTIQPAGVRFNPPARLTFPNTDGLLPSSVVDLWSLSPDTGTFSVVGKMIVSADGQNLETIEGGVVASAWHFPLAEPVQPDPEDGTRYCAACAQKIGSETDLQEGSLSVSHTTPSYRSLGQSRSITLVYRSTTSDVKPLVSFGAKLVSVPITGGISQVALPRTLQAVLAVGGVQVGETYISTTGLPGNRDSIVQISMQFDGSNLPTGRYPFQSNVFSKFQNSAIGAISNSNVIVVNRKTSPIGTGWAIAGVQQIHPHDDGVLLTSGDGTALFFSGGPNVFTPPAGDFTNLVKNGDNTYTRTLKDGTRINFSAAGLQTSVVDRNNNSTTYAYNGNLLATITDPAGLLTTFTYVGGLLQKITDPAGKETTVQHDSAGNISRITNPDGFFVTYGYTGSKLTSVTDERQHTTTYDYDFAGRFFRSTKASGETRTLISSKIKGLANLAAGVGTPTNPAPPVLRENATASYTDGNGKITTYVLDSAGRIISQTDALSHTTTTKRDVNGLPIEITRPNGAVTTMTYDGNGNLLTSTDAMGATTVFTYDTVFTNQVKTIRDPKNNLTTINYDAQGNPSDIIDALGTVTHMTYWPQGLLKSVTSAVGKPEETTTSFAYDARGNLFTTTDPLGNVTTLDYDTIGAGNVFHSTDAENRVTEFTYDAFSRLKTVLDAKGGLTVYTYDEKGNLTKVKDANNHETIFAYNNLDRLETSTNPLSLQEIFTYDNNGNLQTTTNRSGQLITFGYNDVNQLITKTRPAAIGETGSQITSFEYDEVGNLKKIINPTTVITNTYDLANRLESSTSALEETTAGGITEISTDTTINETDFQYEGRTLRVSGRTLTLNGTHDFNELILINGAVLTHSPTTGTKVNKLDITVTKSLMIDATSRIDVNGRGFLGGGQVGNPFGNPGMTVGFASGSTASSGGSYGGLGAASGGGVSNPVYGDFRDPNDPGSGGGKGSGFGGNGGGVVRIVAQTLNLDGIIRANGGNGFATVFDGGGSGGGIRIDVMTLTGAGQITANGGNGSPQSAGGGGGGRIAVYYQDAAAFDLSKINAFGGTSFGTLNAGAGTAYLQGPTRENGELIVDNNNVSTATLSTPIVTPPSGSIALTHFRVRRQGHVRVDSILNLTGTLEVASNGEFISTKKTTASTINLNNTGVISHLPTTGTASFKVDLSANTLTIDATSRIDVNGRGFLGGGQTGNPFGNPGMTVAFASGSTGSSGGSYGGLGIGFSLGWTVNAVYGDFRDPSDPGSGGGKGSLTGGNGGGLVRIVAQTLNLDGIIRANGTNGGSSCCFDGGGSGGGIRIDVGTLSGLGQITANGGNGSPSSAGGGAGGRLAVYYQNTAGFDLSKINAFSGASAGTSNAGAGTVYLQGPTRENGELIVDNNNLSALTLSTPIINPPSGSIALTNFRVRRQGRVRSDSILNLTGALEVASNGEFISTKKTTASTINLNNTGVITHLPTTGTASFKVDLSANTLTIDSTSRIDVNGRGFLGGGQTGNTFGNPGMTVGFASGSTASSGGSYGGLGAASGGGIANPVYGDLHDPNNVGSGGAKGSGLGGNGGGLIRIVAQTLTLNGTISANGANGFSTCCFDGGGSGGGIRVDVGTLSGTGQIAANGGNGSPSSAGGGGGGRVAIYYQTAPTFNFSTQVTATGGISHGVANGQNGSVYLEQLLAMLLPVDGEAPVMKAEVQTNEALQLASLGTPRALDIPLSNNIRPEMPYMNRVAELPVQIADTDPLYSYDLNGNRTSMIDPTGETFYEYDELNRLKKITNNKGVVTLFEYDALGRRKKLTHGNTVVTDYTYDAASQLKLLTHKLGATVINSFDYTIYDRVGNRKSMTNRDGLHSYTYDELNRLSEAINPLPSNPLESFTLYDAVGNRKESNQNGHSTFNSANQLLEDAHFTYDLYDNNGNLKQKTAKSGGAVTTYHYDAENKLVRVVTNTTTVNYKYDGLGRRVEKEVIGGTTTVTRYVYDNEDILLELDGSNNIVARYTHGPGIDEPLVMEKGGQNYYYHADGLGSITDITNQTGGVAQRYTYSSFGEIESQLDANFVQPYAFTSREYDQETGLYLYRARNYDSSTGRFLQQDTFGGFITLPQSLNRYIYVENNPLIFKDPSGNFTGVEETILIYSGVTFAVAYLVSPEGQKALRELGCLIESTFIELYNIFARGHGERGQEGKNPNEEKEDRRKQFKDGRWQVRDNQTGKWKDTSPPSGYGKDGKELPKPKK